ncbi:hypothetical protein [Nitrospira sp. Kam-Ns4a]
MHFASATGCASWRAKPAQPAEQATAERLTGLLKEREAAIETMKGLFSAKLSGPGVPFAHHLEGAMYYRRPRFLRLQGFNRLGGELFEFVLGDDLYRLRLAATGQVYSGRVQDLEQNDKIGRPFQLSVLAVSETIAVESVREGQHVLLSEEGDRYRLDVFAGGTSGLPVRQIWFDRPTLHVVQEYRLTPTGEVEAMLEFEDYRPIGVPGATATGAAASDAFKPVLRPFKVTIKDGHGQGTLLLTFKEIVPNPSLRPEDLGVAGPKAGGSPMGLSGPASWRP